jgi:DNA mismatch endonuclease, patch repair protein
MVDVHSKKTRSFNMSRIRAKHTRPEVALRRALSSRHVRGYRLRTTLPGRPDLVFGRAKVAIFIDGCFWHGCPECSDGHLPKSNRVYWVKKIKGNRARDVARTKELRRAGWLVLRIWEHSVLRQAAKYAAKIERIVVKRRARFEKPL